MKQLLYTSFLCLLIAACKHKDAAAAPEAAAPAEAQTPVTVTGVTVASLADSIELNATSAYLQDNVVKANLNGYVKSVNTKPGAYARAGQTLFVLKTKEAESLGNTINKLDPSFHFTGVVSIKAAQSGYVTQLSHQVGDYVQDGEQLAVISNSNSFGFVLNIPYAYSKYASPGKAVDVVLPDGTILKGTVTRFLPALDSASQTQTALVQVKATASIPENLIAKVRLVKMARSGVVTVPRAAVLSNESQTSFWVMKMIDSTTAAKTEIIKGLTSGDRIEVVRPVFTADDKVVVNGAYGLTDTAKVKLVKAAE